MYLVFQPAEVERSRSYSALPSPGPGVHSHHDHARNAHHKEALRLALGSILAPKRPHPSISRPVSGSATPVYSTGGPTDSLLSRPSDSSHLHPRPSPHPHSHSHPHLYHAHHPSPPLRLGRPVSHPSSVYYSVADTDKLDHWLGAEYAAGDDSSISTAALLFYARAYGDIVSRPSQRRIWYRQPGDLGSRKRN